MEVRAGDFRGFSHVRGYDVHRKRSQFHGEIDCRAITRENAFLLRVYDEVLDTCAVSAVLPYLVPILLMTALSDQASRYCGPEDKFFATLNQS